MKYSIEPATLAHVAAMAPNIRQADRNEVMASAGRDVELLLPECVERAEMAWAGLVDDEVACIFGVQGASFMSLTGYPWMIGTDLIEQHAKPFLRRNRKMVSVMLDRYPHLVNYVDARNAKAIEWLNWLGFTIHPPEKYGAYRMMFHPFEMEK
ncbi:hypothetical protein [Herminiimonas contaminans]|uniref:N-acetyltransferase domain-containing protein n=1 Tax=Herminiimonas contaminans TaxID=1111140 RepID=A0ABS0ESM6_9BURK|nr:hypothetical protein [Herminiimonas contaminans]MBF8177806.1 hypothetical protein [Herminiimonas contaminans]